jgi:tetratricopeptide (TPR) repeat protein
MRAALTAIALAISSGSLAAEAEGAVGFARAAADAGNTTNAEQAASAEASPPTHERPLVAYALELIESDSKPPYSAIADLRAAHFEMARHPPPPGNDCAHTLGASRFADQYAELASIQFSLGDYEASIKADESALECTPRDASLHASIASANLSLGRIENARVAVERGYAIDPDNDGIQDVRARVDFVQERWADATARFRLASISGEPRDFVDYHECFFWLAQRRAGVLHPELPLRPREPGEPGKADERMNRWPLPVLDLLQGKLTEAALVQTIRDEAESGQRREWLTEALYYVGELRLAEGDVETARRHFASVVNLRVLNFVEFGMARAELARMRERAEVARKVSAEER